MDFIIKQLSQLLAKVVELKGEDIEHQANAEAALLDTQILQAQFRVSELEELLEKAEQDLRELHFERHKQRNAAAASVRGHYQDQAGTVCGR